MEQFSFYVFLYVVIVISAVFHEYAHGWVAYRLGDPTAKQAGRLTLNPLVHLDPVGTVLLPLLLLFTVGGFIGWAKPVPYNPFLLSDRRYGSLKVGLAGPAANLIIALGLGLLLRFSAFNGLSFIAPEVIGFIVFINIFLALFNLIPIPPLDGSKIFMDLFPQLRFRMMQFGFLGMFLALIIAIYLLGPLARVIFTLITGSTFL